jgi:hypothetical protein
MIDLSQNRCWNYLFILLTTNVYFACQSLQLSSLITSDAHNKATIYVYAYDLIYSILTVFMVTKISGIYINHAPNILLYYIFYILGGLGFAMLGEVPFLNGLAIVPGFWKHLNNNAKLTIIVFAIGIIILGIIQLLRAINDRDCCKHFIPYLLFFLFYGTTLCIMLATHASNINIHVHHAICASLLSFWFTDWNSKSSMIFHAILMGVVVEGIDFYGIGELSLFLINTGNLVAYNISLVITAAFFFLSIPFIFYFNCYKYKYIRQKKYDIQYNSDMENNFESISEDGSPIHLRNSLKSRLR